MKALKITVEFYVENENAFFPFTTKIAPALEKAVGEVAESFDLRQITPGSRGPFPSQSVALVEVADADEQTVKSQKIRAALREHYGGG